MLDLDNIFNDREIAESSKKIYIRNIIRLNNGTVPNNLNFLNNKDDILLKIDKYKPNTQRNYIISIVTLLSSIPNKNKKVTKLLDEYTKIMNQYNNDLRTNKNKTDKEIDNWLDPKEINDKYLQLLKVVKTISAIKVPTKEQYDMLIDLLLLSLYIKLSPRRVKDYTDMFVVKNIKDTTDQKKNYIVLKDKIFIFNSYKTASTYGQQTIKIPDDVFTIIKLYIRYLLKDGDGNIPFIQRYNDSNKVTQKFIYNHLSDMFNKKVSASMFRKVYLTSKYKDILDEMEKDSYNMSTSIPSMINHYIKID